MKRFPGIDYEYKPNNMFDKSLKDFVHVVSRIKGTNRQRMAEDYYNNGNFESLDPIILHESLGKEQIESFSRIDPSFLGGEFLDDFFENEVEVARIVLCTAHLDTISIRAQKTKNHSINLRIIDEYDSEFPLEVTQFDEIPTFAELVDWFEHEYSEEGGLILMHLKSAADSGAERSEIEDFVSFKSFYYPELSIHTEMRIKKWLENYYSTKENDLSFPADEKASDPVKVFIDDTKMKKLKRFKARTLFSMFGYKKRSEANVISITNDLLEKGVVVAPCLLKQENEWQHSLDDWLAAYPVWQSQVIDDRVAETIKVLKGKYTDEMLEKTLNETIDWVNTNLDSSEPLTLLYLLSLEGFIEVSPLQVAQDAVEREPNSGRGWICVGHYVGTSGYDNVEALSCFYKAEENANTIFERAYALSWICFFQESAGANRYVKQAEKKLAELLGTRVTPLPVKETSLVEVFYPSSYEIKGMNMKN